MRDTDISRRLFLAGCTASASFLTAEPAMATVSSSAERNVDLGIAIPNAVVSPAAGYGVTPRGEPQIYFVASGSPAMFSAVDANTGARVFSQSMPGAVRSWGMVTAPDGSLYIGTGREGQLWRHEPGSTEVERIGRPVDSEDYIYQLDHDGNGVLYGSTWPNAKLFSYDLSTGECRDYGNVFAGEQYARCVAFTLGRVYVGTAANAHLVKVHPETGEMSDVPLPPGYEDQRYVFNLNASGRLLFVRMQPATEMLVYDVVAETWIDTVPDVRHPGDTSERGPGNSVYFAQYREQFILQEFDLQQLTYNSTGFETTGAARGAGWLPIDGYPGRSLVSTNHRAHAWLWNPQTATGRRFQADPQGVPYALRSLGSGPFGDIYVSGHQSPPGMAVVDADTGDMSLLPGGQVEGFGAYGDKLWIGTYPEATISCYDPERSAEPGVNPRQVGHIDGQDRPFAFASTRESVFVGTVPVRGSLAGALTRIDPETGAMDIRPGIVEEQSPIVLAEQSGLIYGGTTIWGGLGVEPTTTEGNLFIFDPIASEKVHQTVPVDEEGAVSGLAFDSEGMLWGITANWLFAFDPQTREIVLRKRLFNTDPDQRTAYRHGRGLVFHQGLLVASAHNQVFEIDPDTLEKKVVAEGNKGQASIANLAIDRHGNYYYTRGTHVWRYEPKA